MLISREHEIRSVALREIIMHDDGSDGSGMQGSARARARVNRSLAHFTPHFSFHFAHKSARPKRRGRRFFDSFPETEMHEYNKPTLRHDYAPRSAYGQFPRGLQRPFAFALIITICMCTVNFYLAVKFFNGTFVHLNVLSPPPPPPSPRSIEKGHGVHVVIGARGTQTGSLFYFSFIEFALESGLHHPARIAFLRDQFRTLDTAEFTE